MSVNNLIEDFVSNENRQYKFKIGTLIASSLSGFIAGVLLTSIAWLLYILVGKV